MPGFIPYRNFLYLSGGAAVSLKLFISNDRSTKPRQFRSLLLYQFRLIKTRIPVVNHHLGVARTKGKGLLLAPLMAVMGPELALDTRVRTSFTDCSGYNKPVLNSQPNSH